MNGRTAIFCSHCGSAASLPTNAVNRARRDGLRQYCDRRCSGLGRRKGKSRAQIVAEKAEYDRAYRADNLQLLKVKKRDYHLRTYDPIAAAVHRQTRMPSHVEYCRRPQYRKWKAEYDRQYCARKGFGDFGEAAILLNDLIAEITSRSTFTERAIAKGNLNKSSERKRDYVRQTQRR